MVFWPDKIPTNVILRTVGAKLRAKTHFRVELRRNLSINGELPGFEFGGFPVLRKYGALN